MQSRLIAISGFEYPLRPMQCRFLTVCLAFLLLGNLRPACAQNTYVRFNTNFGNIDVELRADVAPNTVANFLSYVNGATGSNYTNSIIHRSATLANDGVAVIQGGEYYISNNAYPPVFITQSRNYTTNPLLSEAGQPNSISNTRGTLAMALSDFSGTSTTNPNSATTQWYFNEIDDSELDPNFTVFGVIADTSSLSVMDQIAGLTTFNFGGDATELPLQNYTTAEYQAHTLPAVADFVTIFSIAPLTVQDFPTWQTAKFTTIQQGTPNFTGAADIPWKDGVPNLLKYLCDIDPSVPMTAAARANLPTLSKTITGGVMTLIYHQISVPIGVNLAVETSSDLQTWTTVSNPVFVPNGTDSNGNSIIQIKIPFSGTRQFVRLNVTQST